MKENKLEIVQWEGIEKEEQREHIVEECIGTLWLIEYIEAESRGNE